MEVHHHSHHPKKWKEYLTEFVMLFAAVTLGFFAENKREEMVESHRAKQYMQSLYEDLKKDTSMLNSLEAYDNLQIRKLDTVNTVIINNVWNDSTLTTIYRANLKTLGNVRLSLNERTSSQLKNSGGMRMIENQEISNKISEYWELSEVIKNFGLGIEELKLKAREKSYSIFDQRYYINTSTGEVVSHPILMTYDKYVLTEYSNRLNHIMNSMRYVRTPFIKQLNDKAKEILIALKKEYHINDETSVNPIFKERI
jgi:hypothetical protein